jgi:addiction module RelE/StbE family toxin
VKIRIAPAASAHLTDAFEYLDAINSKAAAAQMKRIFDGIDQLKRFPQSAPVGRVQGTRELVIPRTPFLVVYSVDTDIINIVAILHASLRWP